MASAAADAARAAKTEQLNAIHEQNNAEIAKLKIKVDTHEARRIEYGQKADAHQNRGELERAHAVRLQSSNEAKLRDREQDSINQLRSRNEQINREITEINRPPGTPQQRGRAAEPLIAKVSGWLKNEKKFDTSFPGPGSPDGKRIPDFVPIGIKGGWRNAVNNAELSLAECVADSKVVPETGRVKLNAQIKGFIELASKTKNRALLLITDEPIDGGVYEFAARKYQVTVHSISQPPRQQSQ